MGFSIKTLLWASAAFSLLCATEAVLVPSIDAADEFSVSLPKFAWKHARPFMKPAQIVRVLATRLQGGTDVSVPKLATHLQRLCRQHRFDPAFVLSLIEQESRFHVKARSPAGAIGLMQLMPATADWLAPKGRRGVVTTQLLVDPYDNLTLGVTYLAYLRDRYGSSSPLFLLTAYRLGPARMDALLRAAGTALKDRWVPGLEQLDYYRSIRRGTRRFRTASLSIQANEVRYV